MHERPNMVVVTHMAPIPNAPNAGQSFVTAHVRYWSDDYSVRCLMIPGRSAREDIDQAIAPCHVLSPLPNDGKFRIRGMVDRRILRSFPGVASPGYGAMLSLDDTARGMIEKASVVVLEWQREAGLARYVRKINPNVTIVGVLHDVDSQHLGRVMRGMSLSRNKVKTAAQYKVAQLATKRIVDDCDVVVVLSEKDRRLLPHGSARVAVVRPSVTAPESPSRTPQPRRTIFVASARPNNEEGIRWFLNRVNQKIAGGPLRGDLRIVGRQAWDTEAELKSQGLDLPGFVDDLTREYEHAAVSIVPLLTGAGVKFKTIEAILHRVPIVTTPVGAEGVEGLEHTNRVSTSPEQFAERLSRFLTDPKSGQMDADELFETVRSYYSPERFQSDMRQVLSGG